jgi:outer membrane autotransporter protein
MIKLAIASALTLAAFSASAQMYGEVGVTSVKYEESFQGAKLKSSPVAIRGVFGYEINPNFAVEGLVAFGMSDDDIKLNGNTIARSNFKVDNVIGIYAKPKVKLTPELEGFVRAGFAQSNGTASLNGQSSSASESGFSYGLGMSYALNKTTSINVDYMSYLDKNVSTATGFTFGVGYKF